MSLVERAEAASQGWHPMPTIDDMKTMDLGDGVTIIITCADPRADPSKYLGLNPGEMPILRNAGGRVTDDMLSSLELMSTVMPIARLIVIHHTNCGGIYMTEEGVRSNLAERFPNHAHSIENKKWGTYHDIGMEQSIRDDVAVLKKWNFLNPTTKVGGYIFDIKTGKLQEVVAEA